MYRERVSRIAGAVVWQRTVLASDARLRVLPDGCMDLICAGDELMVAGPDTAAYVTTGPSGLSYAGIRFAPGTGPALFGVPAYELRDERAPLSDLWPAPQVRELTDYVCTAGDRAAALEVIADRRLRQDRSPDRSITQIVTRLRAQLPVAAIAADAGVSERQLHRRCLTAFGYGPKVLGRILRMNRALAMARAGMPFAAVADEAGYADQAHLARDVRALAGVPLSMLIG